MPVPAGGYEEPIAPSEWAPQRSSVADYVPHRTLVRDTSSVIGSDDEYLFTWDDTTTPTGDTVDRLIADGVAWVSARVRPMHASSQDSARVVATLYAAAAVEKSWPEDDQAIQRAESMEKRMDALLAALIVANDAAVAGDGDAETVDTVLPYWSFPEPDSRYDSATYF